MLSTSYKKLAATVSALIAKIHYWIAYSFITFFSFSVYAAQSSTPRVSTRLSAADIILNLAKQVPYITQLVTAIAYVMGMYFIIAGVIKLKHMGESRTMMSQEHSVKAPITFLVLGALLLYLPSSVQMGLSTFWTEPNPYGYLEEVEQWTKFINAVFIVIQLIGVIAFIRGLVILSHSAQGHQGKFALGITHIIGGILCINMYGVVQVIMQTLGFESF